MSIIEKSFKSRPSLDIKEKIIIKPKINLKSIIGKKPDSMRKLRPKQETFLSSTLTPSDAVKNLWSQTSKDTYSPNKFRKLRNKKTLLAVINLEQKSK